VPHENVPGGCEPRPESGTRDFGRRGRLGEEGAAKELEILRVVSGQVQRWVRSNYGKIDDNDDELIKSLADHAFAGEHFSWDNLPG